MRPKPSRRWGSERPGRRTGAAATALLAGARTAPKRGSTPAEQVEADMAAERRARVDCTPPAKIRLLRTCRCAHRRGVPPRGTHVEVPQKGLTCRRAVPAAPRARRVVPRFAGQHAAPVPSHLRARFWAERRRVAGAGGAPTFMRPPGVVGRARPDTTDAPSESEKLPPGANKKAARWWWGAEAAGGGGSGVPHLRHVRREHAAALAWRWRQRRRRRRRRCAKCDGPAPCAVRVAALERGGLHAAATGRAAGEGACTTEPCVACWHSAR
jgi:hypothetical protein